MNYFYTVYRRNGRKVCENLADIFRKIPDCLNFLHGAALVSDLFPEIPLSIRGMWPQISMHLRCQTDHFDDIHKKIRWSSFGCRPDGGRSLSAVYCVILVLLSLVISVKEALEETWMTEYTVAVSSSLL